MNIWGMCLPWYSPMIELSWMIHIWECLLSGSELLMLAWWLRHPFICRSWPVPSGYGLKPEHQLWWYKSQTLSSPHGNGSGMVMGWDRAERTWCPHQSLERGFPLLDASVMVSKATRPCAGSVRTPAAPRQQGALFPKASWVLSQHSSFRTAIQ
jgi:hypothetical protein